MPVIQCHNLVIIFNNNLTLSSTYFKINRQNLKHTIIIIIRNILYKKAINKIIYHSLYILKIYNTVKHKTL